jgi:hypothetical protein
VLAHAHHAHARARVPRGVRHSGCEPDSQEAAIISSSYRKALAPKADTSQGGNQLLMVSPNAGGGAGAQTLAPSIPSGN